MGAGDDQLCSYSTGVWFGIHTRFRPASSLLPEPWLNRGKLDERTETAYINTCIRSETVPFEEGGKKKGNVENNGKKTAKWGPGSTQLNWH